ncbi:7TM diverse intracellular signaling domain-containing protein, partial [Xanthovirga aplysinae]|uniref:7TM diverse intracellular signaling domain-containing protein n=1 Tax=Xanthovirga aplysinae TaxID=2529853 RepID=UPI0012BC8616
MKLLLSLFTLILSLIFSSESAWSKTPDYLIPSKKVYYWKDSTGHTNIQQIIDQPNLYPFNTNPKNRIYNLEHPGESYWVRITLDKNDWGNETQTLEAIDSHIDYIDAYLWTGDSLINYGASGYIKNFEKKDVAHKNFLYELPPAIYAKDSATFYFNIISKKPSPLLFKLRSLKFNFHYATTEYLLLGFFYGFLTLVILYNLFLFFSVGDKKNLFYVIYILSCLVFTLYEDSLGFQYLWPKTPWINSILEEIFLPFYLVALLLYAHRFLTIEQSKPKLNRLIYIATGIFIILYYIDEQLYSLGSIPYYIYLVTLIYLFVVTLKGQSLKKEPIILFIIGFTIIGFAVTIPGVLQKLGILPYDSIPLIYSFNIGILIQCMFFSLAMAQSFRKVKEEKEEAQNRIIEQLRTNERVISQKVKERTEEVEQQKEVIEEKSKELSEAYQQLQEHAEEIKRMNQLLNKENEALQQNLVKLTKARVMMQEVDMDEFLRLFPDEEACYKFLATEKWKNGYSCKKCNNEKYSEGQGQYARRCSKCGYSESATAETIFHRLHFSILKAFYLLFLVYSNQGKITSKELAEALDLRVNTCWKYAKK